ncbi:MAG: hypothetical protein QM733_23710 [Ilumatobacteraceae bacterium]
MKVLVPADGTPGLLEGGEELLALVARILAPDCDREVGNALTTASGERPRENHEEPAGRRLLDVRARETAAENVDAGRPARVENDLANLESAKLTEDVADDERRRSLGAVENPSDGLVERGGGVEPIRYCVGEPVPQSVEERRHAVAGVPLGVRVEVEAEPLALEHVREPDPAVVEHSRMRRRPRVGAGDGQDE